MKNRTSEQRANTAMSADNVCEQAGAASASLSATEIESLLKMARQNAKLPPPRVQVEELGPGDVQYLQGTSIPTSFYLDDMQSSLPLVDVPSVPDEELSEAELPMTEVMPDSRPARFEEFHTGSSQPVSVLSHAANQAGLTMEDLSDLNLDISIELGRAEILIDDVLKLREGSIVTLDKLAGDPVDIIANGRLVARGELLVVDGKFGVRLSEVL